MSEQSERTNILALDVGDRRIGVAVARQPVLLATPLTTIENDKHVTVAIKQIVVDNQISTVVVGLPRGLDGQETKQTAAVREFIVHLADALPVPVQLQDEAVTSVKAEAELKSRQTPYNKGQIDSLAAVYILEDYIGGLGAKTF